MASFDVGHICEVEMKRFFMLLSSLTCWGFFLLCGPALSETPDELNQDHWQGLSGPFADGISVTKACLECHEEQGKEMLSSAHWLWKGPTPYLMGHETDNELGKTNLINNY